jgi:lysophospholipase L1-like esterase
MAFGDSLTEGEWWPGHTVVQTMDPTKSYPTFVLQSLQARYPTQQFDMRNRGRGGSRAQCNDSGTDCRPDDIALRFSQALEEEPPPQVLLLLQGINDLVDNPDEDGVARIRTALKNDIAKARARGAWVFLSTLAPTRHATIEDCPPDPDCKDKSWFTDNPQLLTQANAAIRSLAQTEPGVTLVDGFNIITANVNKYVGADGVHLSIEGYQALAAGFFDAIKAKYEVAAPVPQWSKGPSIAAIGSNVEVRPEWSR